MKKNCFLGAIPVEVTFRCMNDKANFALTKGITIGLVGTWDDVYMRIMHELFEMDCMLWGVTYMSEKTAHPSICSNYRTFVFNHYQYQEIMEESCTALLYLLSDGTVKKLWKNANREPVVIHR